MSKRIALVGLTAFFLAGCSLLSFIEDRLDPPEPGPTGITFRYKAPAARQLNLAGEFNSWLGTQDTGRLDPNIDPMRDLDGDGVWEITLPLPPGRYKYKFVIDQVDWQEDPSNPETVDDDFGGLNSVLVVPPDIKYEYDQAYLSHSQSTSSRLQREYDYVFSLTGRGDANEVFVTGDWSNWDPTAAAMTLGVDGVWHAKVKLAEGDHVYKFVVDGQWMADPDNPEGRDDGYGGTNSVANVRPN